MNNVLLRVFKKKATVENSPVGTEVMFDPMLVRNSETGKTDHH
jgi:hypothetical protein